MATRMNRLRHIHLPESAPHYPPLWLAQKIDKHYRNQFFGGDPTLLKVDGFKAELACPPPAVLSFTPHPVYAEFTVRKLDWLRRALSEPLRLTWPQLHGDLEPVTTIGGKSPSRVEREKPLRTNVPYHDNPFDYTYLPYASRPLQKCMPRYQGPGSLVLWPILNVALPGEGRSQLDIEQSHAALLTDVTIAMLKREFGIKAYVDREFSSLTVRSGAEIAKIWPIIENGISSCGVTINIAEPARPVMITTGGFDAQVNRGSEEPLPVEITTVAAQLALPGTKLPKSGNLVKLTPSETEGEQFYMTRSYDGTSTSYAPLGMDNYSIAVSWTYELASMMNIPFVDHKGTNSWDQRNVSRATKLDARLPVRPRICDEDPAQFRKYNDVGPDSEFARHWAKGLGPNDRVPSWRITEKRLIRDLDKSIHGKKLDTRKAEIYGQDTTIDETTKRWLKFGPTELAFRNIVHNSNDIVPNRESAQRLQPPIQMPSQDGPGADQSKRRKISFL